MYMGNKSIEFFPKLNNKVHSNLLNEKIIYANIAICIIFLFFH